MGIVKSKQVFLPSQRKLMLCSNGCGGFITYLANLEFERERERDGVQGKRSFTTWSTLSFISLSLSGNGNGKEEW